MLARRYPRKLVSVEVKAQGRSAAGQLQFDAMDLSMGGAFLKSDILFDEGEPLVLEMQLSQGSICGAARVVWVRRLVGEPGMGVEFMSLSEDDRRTIETFLNEV